MSVNAIQAQESSRTDKRLPLHIKLFMYICIQRLGLNYFNKYKESQLFIQSAVSPPCDTLKMKTRRKNKQKTIKCTGHTRLRLKHSIVLLQTGSVPVHFTSHFRWHVAILYIHVFSFILIRSLQPNWERHCICLI